VTGASYARFAALQADVIECRRCPRLVAWREQIATEKRAAFRNETYWGKPVPTFGDSTARVLVVGLAPAAHGANRTGRMFTGDRSGDWLFRALHRAAFASQAEATSVDDGLLVDDVAISAIVRCAPPDNKPTTLERDTCRPWLEDELALMDSVQVVVALGGLSFDQTMRIGRDTGWDVPRPKPRFGHGVEVPMGEGNPVLIGSYHPSQQNTFTGRLTEPMLDAVFSRARSLLV
jgi:uracil-DNA glycosylase family 4